MSSSYTNIIVHLIFHVKEESCLMQEKDLPRIFQYIGGIIHNLSGHVYIIGGRPDHIHILANLPISQSISDFARNVKSNSSRWIKEIAAEYRNFGWQTGYGAFSVSESNKSLVFNYINKQEEHHKKQSAKDEFAAFLVKHGLTLNKMHNEH